MKNDFDFIKEKIENSGVKAPQSLSEDAVRRLIDDRQPAPIPLKPKRKWTTVAVIAASLTIVVSLGVVLGARFFGNPGAKPSQKPPVLSAESLGLITFDSYDEVKEEVKKIRSDRSTNGGIFDFFEKGMIADYAVSEDAAAPGSAHDGASVTRNSVSSSSAEAHSDTYKQVEGVDEADIIKTDGKYIYCVDQHNGETGTVKIFVAEGSGARQVAELKADGTMTATNDEAERYDDFCQISELFLNDGRMILLCNGRGEEGARTIVKVYDIANIDDIRLIGDYSQSGRYVSSRMIGEMLYIVSTYASSGDEIIPLCGGAKIPCDCVYEIPDPNSESFLVISAYNTRDFSAQTESRAILGAVDDVYCNEDNLYIYTTSYDGDWKDWLNLGAGSVSSRILKVSLTDGLSFAAFTEVNGYINDRYALDESNGILRVATTSTSNGEDVNNLFTLDEKLNVIGSVTGFAEDESIKAVRYMGDTAYVITYEETDPLFVIDLSDPASPKILGEAKITGFSTMLVPVGDDLVLGLGYHTENESYTTLEVQEGFKLALFDVSDKTNPKVLDSKSFVDCYSAVQSDPRSLVYNPDRDDYVIPLNYAHYSSVDRIEDAEVFVPEEKEEFYGGMLNFKVEDGKIKVIDRYRSDKTENIQRCVYVGDTIYMTYNRTDADGDLALDTVAYK